MELVWIQPYPLDNVCVIYANEKALSKINNMIIIKIILPIKASKIIHDTHCSILIILLSPRGRLIILNVVYV